MKKMYEPEKRSGPARVINTSKASFDQNETHSPQGLKCRRVVSEATSPLVVGTMSFFFEVGSRRLAALLKSF